ncbi:hypothetical protein MJK70_20055 [Klebsiella pneumoniae]|nr:hypothetical protein MJK70_20055 [Klebsiella pneumoniae]
MTKLRPKTRAPSEKQTGKPSKKVLAKRAEKKKAEKEKKHGEETPSRYAKILVSAVNQAERACHRKRTAKSNLNAGF